MTKVSSKRQPFDKGRRSSCGPASQRLNFQTMRLEPSARASMLVAGLLAASCLVSAPAATSPATSSSEPTTHQEPDSGLQQRGQHEPSSTFFDVLLPRAEARSSWRALQSTSTGSGEAGSASGEAGSGDVMGDVEYDSGASFSPPTLLEPSPCHLCRRRCPLALATLPDRTREHK